MISEPRVIISQPDNNLNAQIAWMSSENQPFGNLSLLSSDTKVSPDFATLALNQYILNGQLTNIKPNVSFMSKSISNVTCQFDSTYVESNFSNTVSFYLSYIFFGNNYPKKISIQHFNNSNLIDEEIIDGIDSNFIYTQKPFLNINKLKIIFLESWEPYNYANLQTWLMGGDIVFNKEDLIELKLNENTDPISNRLEIDTAHIEILNKFKNFDPLYNKVVNKFISVGTEVKIYVQITDNETKNINLGKYFVKAIDFGLNNNLILECESFLGIMERVQFLESDMLYDLNQGNLPTVKEAIDRIFDKSLQYIGISGSKKYEYYSLDFDDELNYGYTPPMTCREALRQICFTHNLSVYDNRSDKILVKKNNNKEVTKIIDQNKIVSDPHFEMLDKIYIATIKVHSYQKKQEEKIMTVTSPGEYIFDSPTLVTEVVNVSGGDISFTSNINSINIMSDLSNFVVEVYGEKFQDDPFERNAKSTINNGKCIKISNSNLVLSQNATPILINTCDYFNEHYLKLKIQYINTDEETGDLLMVDFGAKTFTGILVYQSLDVAHGMVATAEILGRENN